MSLINNISIRSEKGRPLSTTELDLNFSTIRNYLLDFESSGNVVDLDLANGEPIRFGDNNLFSLSSDGNSLVVNALAPTEGDPVFVVKDSQGTPLLEVLENGNIQCSGQFSINPDDFSLDLSNLTDLSTNYITLNNFGASGELDAEAESGTLGFAEGNLYVKQGV